MIVSFCFTIKLKHSLSVIEKYKEIIKKAVDYALLYHKVNFYTDEETLPYLQIDGTTIKLIDTSNVYFVDDLKVHLLTIIDENEVIVDTDLFLFKPLHLEAGYDAYFEFKDNSSSSWYMDKFDWFIDNGIRDMIPNFNTKLISVPNIGILKIPNKDLKEKYVELYYKIRNWILSKDSDITLGMSLIIGQYLLGLVMSEYNIYYCKNYNNHYAHLSGANKFKTSGVVNFHPTKLHKLL